LLPLFEVQYCDAISHTLPPSIVGAVLCNSSVLFRFNRIGTIKLASIESIIREAADSHY
jgi:hypothetical protein